MKKLNQSASRIFHKLVEGLQPGESRKIDNTEEVFLPVSVERLTEKTFSIAHYIESNGDHIADPDMTFYVEPSMPEVVVPLALQLVTGHYTEAVRLDASGNPKSFRSRESKELAGFANMWMRNIKEQQGL